MRPAPHLPVGSDLVPQRRGDLAAVTLDGETVLYDEASGAIHILDIVASIAWDCFDGSASIAGIADELAEIFEQDAAVIAGDLVILAAQLRDQGLLVQPSAEEAR